jgi:hypothetical protein
MSDENKQVSQIQALTELKPVHFADLIRAVQLIFDPARGISGIYREVDWKDFGIPDNVVENLKALGKEYQYASPHVCPEIIWSKLTPQARIWFLENKETLWQFEEFFPPLDED